MKTNRTAQDSGWDVSFWFAISSPLLGVLLAIVALADVLPVIEVTAPGIAKEI